MKDKEIEYYWLLSSFDKEMVKELIKLDFYEVDNKLKRFREEGKISLFLECEGWEFIFYENGDKIYAYSPNDVCLCYALWNEENYPPLPLEGEGYLSDEEYEKMNREINEEIEENLKEILPKIKRLFKEMLKNPNQLKLYI